MGNWLLHQSDAARRIRPLPARSQNRFAGGARKKIVSRISAPAVQYPGPGKSFAILSSLARYPSGLRGRSAKPLFVGSNPTRASRLVAKDTLAGAAHERIASPVHRPNLGLC